MFPVTTSKKAIFLQIFKKFLLKFFFVRVLHWKSLVFSKYDSDLWKLCFLNMKYSINVMIYNNKIWEYVNESLSISVKNEGKLLNQEVAYGPLTWEESYFL